MPPRKRPDGIHVAFDDHRLVANAGLLLPACLVLRLGLGELVDQHVDPGDAPGRANPGDKLPARAWAAGAGPGDGPLTIDLDSTICETYGLAKEGARRHGYTGQRYYHPLLAVAAGTGEVLMARLREGRANTARGAAHGAGRQRLLRPFHRRPLPQDEGPLLHHRPPARPVAPIHRGHPRGGVEAHSLLDGGCRRRGRGRIHTFRYRA